MALAYLTEARTAWASWGAVAKVRDLERRHAELFAAAPGAVGAGAETEALDVETVMKAARAISREIEPQRLLRSLVRIAMESAGAERGLLVREQQGQLLVAAEGRIDEEGVILPDIPLAKRSDLPWTMLQWVQQTGEPVVVADAGDDARWLADPYVRERAPRSILVLPIVQQGKRMGFIEENWRLGFIDGPNAPPPGRESFDRIAGSLDGLFDFDRRPHLRPLVLDQVTGTVVDGDSDQ